MVHSLLSARRRATRIGFAMCCCSVLNACATWHGGLQLKEIRPDARVRITRHDGSTVMMRGARLQSDTVYGSSGDGDAPRITIAVPLDSLRNLEVKQHSRTLTMFGGIATFAAFIATAAFVLDRTSERSP